MSGATAQTIDPASLGAAFPRTHHVLMLDFGDRKDFVDPRREWRRLYSELLGAFALVLAAAGGGLLHAKGQISLAAAVVAPGLMVTAIILFMGAVSGAHLNAAVSLAFALRGDFPWKRVPGYIVIQLVGATLACLFLRWVFGNVEHLGATLPGPGYKPWQALLMEIVLTGLLLVGPVAGALIAVGFAFVLRGRGGDVISRAAGSGVLDEGALAAKAELSEDIERGRVVPPGIAGTDSQRAVTGAVPTGRSDDPPGTRVVMTETTPFTIGTGASCSDGVCGKVTRVVVDPVARAVTHLVVEPRHRHGRGRLVPVGLADATTGEIRLRCTLAEFEKLDPAEETQFLPGTPGYPGYDPEQVAYWPYYDLGAGFDPTGGFVNIPQAITYDTVPLDEVEVPRGQHVHATDGNIGKVQGLVIDRSSHHVTHVLLQEGHLWGRKEVAIPISAVTDVEDGIHLNITKQQVHDLPPVDIDHPNG